VADRTEVTRQGNFKSWQEAFGTALDIMEERQLRDVHRVEIDSGELEYLLVQGDSRVARGLWTIKIEGYLGEP
jgi:hypothetical protein